MAKKHKNLKNILIQWDGDLSKPSDGSAQSSPDSVDLGIWGPTTRGWNDDGTYTPVWEASGCYNGSTFVSANCQKGVMNEPFYFEDYDFNNDGVLNVTDIVAWGLYAGRNDIKDYVTGITLETNPMPDKVSESIKPKSYTWGDVSFVIEIADGLGTGSRRAREARLNQFEQEKKKRLIRLICRVKGEKVYDEEKEVGDTYIKLEDAELVINEVLGEIKVENANVL